MEQENSNTTQPQGINIPGVDLKAMPKNAIIIVIICGVGILSIFLPWYKFFSVYNVFSYMGGYEDAFSNRFGISTFFGWLTFLSFSGAGAYVLFGKKIKLPEALGRFALLITGGSALLFTSIQFLILIASPYLTASFGLYISFLASIGLFIFALMALKKPVANV